MTEQAKDLAFGEALNAATRAAYADGRPQYVASTPEGQFVTGPADELPAGYTREATVAPGERVSFTRENAS